MNHVLKISGCLERHTADTDFRHEVVLTRLAPMPVIIIIPGAIETVVIKIGRDIVALIETA